MDITIKLNKPFPEIEKHGYRSFRFGPSIQLGQIVKEDDKKGNSNIANWKESDSRNFMRNPGTGAITVRPSGLRDDFFTSGAYTVGRFDGSEFNYTTAEWQTIEFSDYDLQDGALFGFLPKNAPDTALTEFTVSSTFAEWTARTELGGTMAWTHETTYALPKNAGFGVVVQPQGLAFNRSDALMCIGFGGRYVLEVKTNGASVFYAFILGEWKVLKTFDHAISGVEASKPFQINIIPNSFGHISFFFSQYSQSTKIGSNYSGKQPPKETSFTVDLKPYFSVLFDASVGASNTIPSSTILLGFRKTIFKCLWSAYKNLYTSSDSYTAVFQPEVLPYKMPHAEGDYALTVEGFGYQSDNPIFLGSNRVDLKVTKDDGTGEWDKTQKLLSVNGEFYPSTWYSPELWGYRLVIPEKITTPTWTPEQVDTWTSINFRQSLDLEPMSCDIKFIDLPQSDIFKSYGPIEIKAKDTIIFEGYLNSRQPIIEGESLLLHDKFNCLDTNTRFSETPAGFDSVAGVTVRDAIERLINSCGIPSTDIDFEDDDNWTNTTVIEMPEGGDQNKLWDAETTVSEALQTIFDLYTMQGQSKLYLVKKDGRYKLISHTFYQYAKDLEGFAQPTKTFWAIEPTGYTTDQDRWDAEKFKILSPIEFAVSTTPFNSVRVATSTDTGGAGKGVGTTGGAIVYDVNGSITDPTSDEFVGRYIEKTLSAPKTFQVTNLKEAERYARILLQNFNKKRITCNFRGEWQPGIWAGDIVSLLGAINDEGTETIVSFGAFRLIEMNVEITSDWDGGDYLWSADYSLEYWGPSEYEDIPFFNPGHHGHQIL